jgi:hypothetical protein
MLLNELHRFTAWMSRSLHKAPADRARQPAESAFDFDPMWHGDHWQNLLSSPMDARHYVMEDWSVVIDFESLPGVLATDIR